MSRSASSAEKAFPSDAFVAGRPTRHLPLQHLLELSVYWLGLTAIWVGLDATILPARIEPLVGPESLGTALLAVTVAGAVVPIVIQPTIGAISDHTTSRWGRRKPYIAIGAVLDVVFLYALASADTYLALVVAYLLLQLSSNVAQGPFQGYVPDLVPARQVGLASGLMGLMIVLGQLAGVAIATLGLVLYDESLPIAERLFLPTVGLGLLELATAALLLATVHEGPPGRARDGRSWRTIALSAWGLDLLRQRSFVWLVLSRLCFLAAAGVVVRFALPFLQRTMGLGDRDAGSWQNVALLAVVVPTALTVIPAARLSDRVGRKPVILASCAVGAVGLAGVALAPELPLAVALLVPVGVAAGAFLAVDWALMTDIIPKAASGRYMGISNIGTAAAGPLGLLVAGPVLDLVARAGDVASSPRAAYLVGVGFFLAAAVFLRPVDPTRQD